MDQLSNRIKQITNELKHYFEARIDLLVLNVSEEVTGWIGESIQKLVGYIIIGLGLLFAMFALAIYLGDLLGNDAIGYLIVAIPMLIIGMIFSIAGRKGLAKQIQNQFMQGIIKSIEKPSETPQLGPHHSKSIDTQEQDEQEVK